MNKGRETAVINEASKDAFIVKQEKNQIERFSKSKLESIGNTENLDDEDDFVKKDFLSQRPKTPDEQDERFKHLQLAMANTQKKTFTKWCNSQLRKRDLTINDLYHDLENGILLWNLLEILSEEELGKPNSGKLRVQKIENVNVCLAFLSNKVHLENIGSEDIVDGNGRLILGLIWTIILRYQIEHISITLTQEESRRYSMSGFQKDKNSLQEAKAFSKNALLIWCQRQTFGYKGVDITNFSYSWRNGLGFLALIHSYRPDLVDYESYEADDAWRNLKDAFEIADIYLGINKLLDPEDVMDFEPDERSIITYVSCLYHYFHNPKLVNSGKVSPTKMIKLQKANIADKQALFEHQNAQYQEKTLKQTTNSYKSKNTFLSNEKTQVNGKVDKLISEGKVTTPLRQINKNKKTTQPSGNSSNNISASEQQTPPNNNNSNHLNNSSVNKAAKTCNNNKYKKESFPNPKDTIIMSSTNNGDDLFQKEGHGETDKKRLGGDTVADGTMIATKQSVTLLNANSEHESKQQTPKKYKNKEEDEKVIQNTKKEANNIENNINNNEKNNKNKNNGNGINTGERRDVTLINDLSSPVYTTTTAFANTNNLNNDENLSAETHQSSTPPSEQKSTSTYLTEREKDTSSPSFLQQIKKRLSGSVSSSSHSNNNNNTSEKEDSNKKSPIVSSPPLVAKSVAPLTVEGDKPIVDYYAHNINTSNSEEKGSPMSSSTIIKKTITTTRTAGGGGGGGASYGSSSYASGIGGGSAGFGDASFAASPKATIAYREKEKKELQDLNERFASYIERVRRLEKQHSELIEEIVAIKNELIRIVSSVRAQFESELRDARRELDDTSRDKARLEVRCNRLEDDIDEYRTKYDEISRLHHNERDKLLRLEVLLSEKDGELANLQKKLDQANDDIDRYKRELERLLDELANAKINNEDELLIRVDLENKLQSLQEDLDFQQQLHSATLKELMEGIRRDDSGDFRRIFQNELSLAIKDIRTEYENISKMMYPDNEGWYKAKIQEFMEITQKKNVEEQSAKDDAKRARSRVSEISTEIVELRNANAALEKRIMELERAIANENSDFEAQLAQRDFEMQELQEKIAAQLFELRELMDTKLRLDLEIAAYRRLLEGEENRLNLSPESIKHVRKAISQIGTRDYIGGGDFSKALPGESSSKTTYQRTSKGPLTIAEVDPEGQFIALENTSKLKDQVLDGWQIRRNIDNRDSVVFTFPKFTIKPTKTIRIYASGYYDGKPDNLEFHERRSWGTGSNVTTTLLNQNGEEKASHTQRTITH